MKQAPFTPPNQLTTADLQNTLTSKQVAEELGITTSCLANWRMNTPSKLPFLKAGGATNSKYQMKTKENNMSQVPQTNTNAFLEDLDGGQFHRKIGTMLSEVAKAVVDTEDKKRAKGKLTITLDLQRIAETAQVMISHDIKYERPTPTGKRVENSGNQTPMHTDINGNLSLTMPNQYQIMGKNGEVPPILEQTDDQLYQQAISAVRDSGRASISHLQRVLKIGYNRSANLIDKLEKEGVISAVQENGTREVIAC